MARVYKSLSRARPNATHRKAKAERAIARQVIAAAKDSTRGRGNGIFAARFGQLYTGRFTQTEFLKATQGTEIRPFFQYFDASYKGESQSLHREAIYGSYLRLLEECWAYAQNLRQGNGANHESITLARGRAAELVAGALIARLRHPNITLVPSLALQDSFGIPADNHDYLYIDTFGTEPIVQPTQIKASIGKTPARYTGYFDSIALVFGDLDLHICTATEEDPSRHTWCIIDNTMACLIQEDTPEKTAALDTLTANLLIKLSTWQDRKESWRQAIHEHTLSNRASQRVRQRQK